MADSNALSHTLETFPLIFTKFISQDWSRDEVYSFYAFENDAWRSSIGNVSHTPPIQVAMAASAVRQNGGRSPLNRVAFMGMHT